MNSLLLIAIATHFMVLNKSYSLQSCPKTIIIDHTHTKWSTVDKAALTRASAQCKVYYPEAPCLKKFIKKEPGTYRAICGSK